MKRKTIYNLIMVAVIVAIVGGGILGVGYIRGWFEKADGGPVLQEMVGVVRIERAGVSYVATQKTVLRPGDQISTQTGATAMIAVGSDYITLGGDGELTVVDVEKPELHLTAGEVFINTETLLRVTFEAENVGIVQVNATEATVAISYRLGAQTVSVFRGGVDDVSAGQKKEYVGGEASVSSIQVESLNSFTISQIRKANRTVELCVTNKNLDDLEEKRRQELEDSLNGTDIPHEHSYQVNVVAPGCDEPGYTEYVCACGDSYREAEVPAIGHSFSVWETIQLPTQTEKGWKQRKCEFCDKIEKAEIDYVGEDHVHEYVKTTVVATCTVDGYTEYNCACGDSYRTDIVPSKGHDYQRRVYEPTCTAEGFTVYTCACGYSYKDKNSVVNALKHSWGDWVTVTEATEDTDGLRCRYCQRCEETQEVVIPMTSQTNYVYMTICCDTILNNLSDLKPEKAEFVPENGIILPMIKVSFNPGETVFDVLQRVCMQQNIQMEYSWTPMYGSYYIEGINNLYEFDCGNESGWMYKVNGWFPNYGVSLYKLESGDQIVFAYTCKGLGTDVGAPEWEGD